MADHNRRFVARLPAGDEIVSIWWCGLARLDIYLKHRRIVLNGTNGWTGMLSGPAVALMAAAAVAICH